MNDRSGIVRDSAAVVLAVAAATAVRLLADEWLGDRFPLAPYFGAVAACVWIGGYKPAIAAALIGYLVANYLFIPPRGELAIKGAPHAFGMFAYLFSCSMIVLIGEGGRMAQRQARSATDYLRQALHGARMVAWERDVSRGRTTVTDNAREFFGLGDLQRDQDGLAQVHPEDRAAHDAAMRRALELGGAYFSQHRILRPADAKTLWVEEHGEVQRGAKGRAVRISGVCIDVTARKEMEEALRHADAQFKEQLFKRAEDLKEADKRKNEFLALLAHELRNPLAPIRNSLHLIEMTDRDGRMARPREVMERQVAQIVRLIDDLLDVSRIDLGKIELHREKVELAKVVTQGIETSQPNIQAMGHRLDIDLPQRPLYVDADPLRLAQVVSNLLNNAAKFTAKGGRIALGAERDGNDVLIRIKDDGIGIPPEQLPVIFDRFVQLERPVDRARTGLGLGLSLVKSLVELHGGRVTARSEGIGRGSEFTVRLPLAPDPQPAEEPARDRAERAT